MRNKSHNSLETLESRQLMSGAANRDGREVYADFNGDGRIDVAVISKGKVSVSSVQVDGVVGPETHGAFKAGGGRPLSVAGGDFNNDGTTDLAVFGVRGTGANARGIIGVLIGYQTGGGPTVPVDFPTESFRSPVVTEVGLPFAKGKPLVGDFDGDGRDDIASLLPTGTVTFYNALVTNEVLPEVEFELGGSIRTPYRAGGQIGLATDDDGGPDDILVINKKGKAFWSDGGRSAFKTLSGLDAETEIIESSADVDGGDFLVWQKGTVSVVELDEAGHVVAFRALAQGVPHNVRQRLVAIDIEGDGDLDLLARHPGGRGWFVPDMDSDQSGMA